VVISSTAHSTLVDHSSPLLFSSSENAILNLLGHLSPPARFEELCSLVESGLSEITDPDGVPSGVWYIAETGDSVDVLEISLLIGGGGMRVSPLSL